MELLKENKMKEISQAGGIVVPWKWDVLIYGQKNSAPNQVSSFQLLKIFTESAFNEDKPR